MDNILLDNTDFLTEILNLDEGFGYFNKPDDDPLKDPYFMAFLNSLAPTTEEIKEAEIVVHTNKRKSSSVPAVTRMGQCEHPKHILYRQERYTTSATPKEATRMKTVPRRGRPPKGYISPTTKPTIVKLTVRPLPKRLEQVVGKSKIKVCLTCLKRSDVDPDYLRHHAYVGPQHVKK